MTTLRFFSALPAPGWGLWNVVRYVFLGEKATAATPGRSRKATCMQQYSFVNLHE